MHAALSLAPLDSLGLSTFHRHCDAGRPDCGRSGVRRYVRHSRRCHHHSTRS